MNPSPYKAQATAIQNQELRSHLMLMARFLRRQDPHHMGELVA